MKHLAAIVAATDAHATMQNAIVTAAAELREQSDRERAERIAAEQPAEPVTPIVYGDSGHPA